MIFQKFRNKGKACTEKKKLFDHPKDEMRYVQSLYLFGANKALYVKQLFVSVDSKCVETNVYLCSMKQITPFNACHRVLFDLFPNVNCSVGTPEAK